MMFFLSVRFVSCMSTRKRSILFSAVFASALFSSQDGSEVFDKRESGRELEGVMISSLSEDAGLEDSDKVGVSTSRGKVSLKIMDRRARLSTLPFRVEGKSSKATKWVGTA